MRDGYSKNARVMLRCNNFAKKKLPGLKKIIIHWSKQPGMYNDIPEIIELLHILFAGHVRITVFFQAAVYSCCGI